MGTASFASGLTGAFHLCLGYHKDRAGEDIDGG